MICRIKTRLPACAVLLIRRREALKGIITFCVVFYNMAAGKSEMAEAK